MDLNFFSGVLSTGGAAVLVSSLVGWIRNRKRDKASARKTNADAYQIESSTMSDGYKQMISSMMMIRAEEKKMFEEMLDDERRECDLKMKEMQIAYSIEIDFLKTEIKSLKNIKP